MEIFLVPRPMLPANKDQAHTTRQDIHTQAPQARGPSMDETADVAIMGLLAHSARLCVSVIANPCSSGPPAAWGFDAS